MLQRIALMGCGLIAFVALAVAPADSLAQRPDRFNDLDSKDTGAVDNLITDLRSPTAITRLLAAKKLGLLGTQARKAIPALKQALQDPDPDVRVVVANALRRIDVDVPPQPPQPPQPQPGPAIKPIEGKLTDQSSKSKFQKDSYANFHDLALRKGKIYRIDVMSRDFDPFILLQQGTRLLATNDDGGDGLNSRLIFVPSDDQGVRLEVTTYKGGQTGNYEVKVAEYEIVAKADEFGGALNDQSPSSNSGQRYAVQKYRFEAGKEYVIDVISSDFDPVLIVRDAGGKTIAMDDDGGTGLNSRMLLLPKNTDTYSLLVYSYKANTVGKFRIAVLPVRPAAGGAPRPPIPPAQPIPSQARLVMTRWALAHGRVDQIRPGGLFTPANPKGEIVSGVLNLVRIIAAQPDPTRVTLDLDKEGTKPRDQNAPSPLVTAAGDLSSGMSLAVCELGPGDTLKRWEWLVPRFGNGNYYATVSIPAAGIVAGQELVTKQHFDGYLANSILYEAPDFGNLVVNHNIEGGTSNLNVVAFNQKDIKLNASVGWANPLELILSEGPQKHYEDRVEVQIVARLPMSFETDLTIRWAAETTKGTIIADSDVTAVRADKSLFRTATFTVRLPKKTKGSVKISAVASPGPFANPIPPAPQSVGLSTFHSKGSTLEDTLSVNVEPDDLEDKIASKLDKAKAKSGDVQISLYWQSKDDLDLHVEAPSGEQIYYGHRTSKCKGQLDVDMNVSYTRATSGAVENVFWPKGEAPAGKYKVYVNHYSHHRGQPGCLDPAPFNVRVVIRGRTQLYSGSVSYSNRSKRKTLVCEFEVE